jgi:hypothetical protein
MDTVLISVTLVSIGLAGVLAVMVGKLRRDERKRSDARVAALTELASEPTSASADEVKLRPAPVTRGRIRHEPQPRREAAIEELEIRPAPLVPVADIFTETERPSPWGRRFAVIGVLAIVGGIILYTVALRRVAPDVNATATPDRRAAAAAIAPLELVSLRHSQEANTLTITGLVHNPKSGAQVTRVTATAAVFGTDGAFLASGKAPLDYTAIAAGDESPFVVTVPVRGAVARYRVGFRAEDGTVLAHVDRRADDVARRAP